MPKLSLPPEWHADLGGSYFIKIPGAARGSGLAIYLLPGALVRNRYRGSRISQGNSPSAWYVSCDSLGIQRQPLTKEEISLEEAELMALSYIEKRLKSKELQVKTWLKNVKRLLGRQTTTAATTGEES